MLFFPNRHPWFSDIQRHRAFDPHLVECRVAFLLGFTQSHRQRVRCHVFVHQFAFNAVFEFCPSLQWRVDRDPAFDSFAVPAFDLVALVACRAFRNAFPVVLACLAHLGIGVSCCVVAALDFLSE